MARIKCPKCGKEFSDRYKVCICCGLKIDNENAKDFTIVNEDNSKIKTNSDTNINCPNCGAPSSLTPKGKVRLCKKCAEEKKLNSNNKNEDTQNIITSKSESQTEINQTYKGFDYTKSNTTKRFIFQFISSIICAGIAFVLGGLIVYIIQELLAGLRLNLLAITIIVMAISSIVVGAGLGLVGPVTLSQGGYVKEENKGFIIRAKSKPLKVLTLTIFSIFTIAGIVLLILAIILYKDKIDPYTDNEDTLMPIIIPFIITVYYFTLTITTLININQSTCPHCGHIDCKLPVGKSDIKTEEEIKEREVTYSGSSYDVVDGSGNTIGYIRTSDSTAKQHRTITTKSWTVYTKCKICGKRSNVKESSTEKTKWE